jgi:rhamnose utilization protein RhaD (predicted bifunctional aldolase and dehydrogenase)
VHPPAEPAEREALVKVMMEQAVLPESTGRASVEAPLHDSLSARYVVHTHPALVNGMTCAVQGKAACAEFFPEALWLDYIDPGFTLCMRVRREIQAFKADRGIEPQLIFLKNHGVFVSSDTPEGIRSLYAMMFDRLKQAYAEAGIALTLTIQEPPEDKHIQALLKRISHVIPLLDDGFVEVSGMFDYATGPISPDHIVYSKSYPLVGEPNAETVGAFYDQHGYFPHVICTDKVVLGMGASETRAGLALEMALEGALVRQLAAAFGGIEYMTDEAGAFIENWEVESYRSQQI